MNYMDLNKKQPATKTKKFPKRAIFISLVTVFLFAVGWFIASGRVMALFGPVSIIGNIAGSQLSETDGRTNVLILGSDRREQGIETTRGVLTDTILVASIGRVEGNVALISLPRDLWIKDYSQKINSVYSVGGSGAITEEVEEVLGIPIHYYVVIDFKIFTEAIDILGGVEIDVERTFTDFRYPIEGKEDAPNEADRYETIRFEAGKQKMNGDTALKYVRSRYGNNGEDTDFARSKRQQKVIMALKDKALSYTTILDPIKLKNLYDSYGNNVDTDIGFNEVQNFYVLSNIIKVDEIRSIVLDDRSAAESGGLLYAPEDTTLYRGAYVLIPRAGNFSQLHAYVQRYIFSE